ncbi:MAG: helix-hairpin-helix domain-containing protein [Geobacteraceae bacterium]
MKKIAVGLFLGLLSIMFVATISFASPDKGSANVPQAKTITKKTRKKSTTKTKLLDINTATAAQLAALPGLTNGDAKQIVSNRPYTRKNQLKQKKIIAAATYDGIKKLIIAKRQKK